MDIDAGIQTVFEAEYEEPRFSSHAYTPMSLLMFPVILLIIMPLIYVMTLLTWTGVLALVSAFTDFATTMQNQNLVMFGVPAIAALILGLPFCYNIAFKKLYD